MGDDFKEKFRAAKAGRTTGKLVRAYSCVNKLDFFHTLPRFFVQRCLFFVIQTKDQLRVLKAQKAQAAAAAAAQPVAAASPDEDTKSMPPPPPRLTPGPSSGAPKPAPASAPAPAPASAPPGRGSYHADSQGTRIQEGGGALGGNLLHSEPSVNKISHPQGQQSEVGASAPPVPTGNATSLAESNALPSGFIDVVVAQGQGSTTGIHLGVVTKAAKSAEGSTGGLEGGEGEPRSGSANPADLATSQLSAMPTWDTAVASRAMPDMQMESAREAASAPAQAPGSLPKNFFDNAAAGAAAMSGPQQHQGTNASAADMDREYAEFMKAVDADEGVADAMAEAAAVEEDEDAVKRSREDFEQL